MTAVRGGDVNGVHLAYKVAQVATRRVDIVIVCESRDPEGMEGTMSSSVSLFKTAAVVVDLQKRQRPLGREAKYEQG